MQPSIEQLAEVFYDSYLASLGDYRPPFARSWADTPDVIRQAVIKAMEAVVAKISSQPSALSRQ